MNFDMNFGQNDVNPTDLNGYGNVFGEIPGMDNVIADPMTAQTPEQTAAVNPMGEDVMPGLMPDNQYSEQDDDMKNFMEQSYLMNPSCFGRYSAVYADQLYQFINDEYRDHLYYLALSRKAPNNSSRHIFRNMAQDELKHARRFGAAYFLITGKKYFPTQSMVGPVSVPSSYHQALRDRYIAESRDVVKYRQFARNTEDTCLKRMANNTSDDERSHAQEIMELIQST